MTLAAAIKQALTPKVYNAVLGHSSPPEILKMAALRCFLHNQEEGVEDTIRAAMIILDATGLMSESVQ